MAAYTVERNRSYYNIHCLRRNRETHIIKGKIRAIRIKNNVINWGLATCGENENFESLIQHYYEQSSLYSARKHAKDCGWNCLILQKNAVV